MKLPVLSQQLAIPRVNLGRGKCCWSLCWSSQAQQTPYRSRGAWSCSQLVCWIWDNGRPWVSALVVRVGVPFVHASFVAELSFQSKVWWCKASFIPSFFFFFPFHSRVSSPKVLGIFFWVKIWRFNPTVVVSPLLQPILGSLRFSIINLLSLIQESTVTSQVAELKQRLTVLYLKFCGKAEGWFCLFAGFVSFFFYCSLIYPPKNVTTISNGWPPVDLLLLVNSENPCWWWAE